jgi:5-methylcytosine-specific restriction endonuclease McrA
MTSCGTPQDLLRHIVPTGDVATVFDRALSGLIEQLEKQKCAATSRPRGSPAAATGSRHIPGAVRREVWRRDHGRCGFVGARGRCAERGFLEFHHVVPFAVGGRREEHRVALPRAQPLRGRSVLRGGSREAKRSVEMTRLGPDRVRAPRGAWAHSAGNRHAELWKPGTFPGYVGALKSLSEKPHHTPDMNRNAAQA